MFDIQAHDPVLVGGPADDGKPHTPVHPEDGWPPTLEVNGTTYGALHRAPGIYVARGADVGIVSTRLYVSAAELESIVLDHQVYEDRLVDQLAEYDYDRRTLRITWVDNTPTDKTVFAEALVIG